MRVNAALCLGVLTLVACDVARPCRTSTDCAGGGICDPMHFVCVIPADAGKGGGSGGGAGTGGGAGAGGVGGGTAGVGGGTAGVGGVGGGGGNDGGADAGMDAGIDAGVPYCVAGLNCEVFEECRPTLDGGLCVNQDFVLQWQMPLPGLVTRDSTVAATVRVSKTDGGAVSLTKVPVDGGATDFLGSNGTYAGMLTLSGADGPRTFVAGWPSPGPRAALVIERDTTPPSVVVVVEPRDGGDADPARPGAWKKDEWALVMVTVDGGPGVEVSQVRTAWDGGVRAASCRSVCVGTCRCFAVELAGAPVPGMSAAVSISVGPVADDAGNLAPVSDAGLGVTRLRWTRSIGSGAFSGLSPLPVAAAGNGVVVAGSREGAPYRIRAFAPDGQLLWGALDAGLVTGGPAMAAGDVWFGWNSGAFAMLQPVSLVGGLIRAGECSNTPLADFGGDLAIAVVDAGDGFPLGIRNGRVQGPVAGNCEGLTLTGITDTTARSSLVAQPNGTGFDTFVAFEGDAKIWKASLSGTTWTGRGDAQLPTFTQPRGLFLDGAGHAGGGGVVGNGALFVTSAGVDLSMSTVFDSVGAPNAGAPVVGAGFVLYGDTSGQLVRRPLDGGAFGPAMLSQALGSGSLQSSMPVLGAGGLVYVIGGAGVLAVRRASDLGEVWSASLDSLSGSGNISQLALDVLRGPGGAKDCSRELGVLYVVTRAGAEATLRAVLVDSAGLDATAPWPKYQHDNANTGNPARSLAAWACP